MQRKCDDWLNTYLAFTEESESPIQFKIWAGIGAISSAMQRKCYVPWEYDRPIFANLYIVLISPPGVRKGTALYPAENLLRSLGDKVRITPNMITPEALIEHFAESTFPMEGGGVHTSLTCYSDELSVLLNAYGEGLLPLLTDWFDCKDQEEPWTYKTKGGGDTRITKPWLNILAASTPDAVMRCVPQNAVGLGLTSRILYIYAHKKQKIISFPQLTPEERRIQKLLEHDMKIINSLCGKFEMDEEFREVYDTWYQTIGSAQRFKYGPLVKYNDRRSLHLRKLSMVLSVSRSDELVLRKCDWDRAIRYLEAAESLMPRVFEGQGRSELGMIVRKICAYVESEGRTSICEIQREFLDDIDTRDLQRCLETLVQGNFCKLINGGKELEFISRNGKKKEVKDVHPSPIEGRPNT